MLCCDEQQNLQLKTEAARWWQQKVQLNLGLKTEVGGMLGGGRGGADPLSRHHHLSDISCSSHFLSEHACMLTHMGQFPQDGENGLFVRP